MESLKVLLSFMNRNRKYLLLILLFGYALHMFAQDNMEIDIKKVPYWYILESKNNRYLVKGAKMDDCKKSPELLIKKLNKSYNEFLPKIIYIGTFSDTIKITFSPVEIYLNQLGSSGTKEYLAAIVYTLTENKQIEYVNVDIKEIGEHGKPGVYSRDNFKDLLRDK